MNSSAIIKEYFPDVLDQEGLTLFRSSDFNSYEILLYDAESNRYCAIGIPRNFLKTEKKLRQFCNAWVDALEGTVWQIKNTRA